MARINPPLSSKRELKEAVSAGLRVIPYEDHQLPLSKTPVQIVRMGPAFATVEVRWDETGPYIAKVIS